MRNWQRGVVGGLAIAVALGLTGTSSSAGKASPAPLQVAYAEADITPPLGGSMPGYFKDRQATGVLDPLKAKVLYLRQGQTSTALVACDLIGMGAPLVRRIRERVRAMAPTRQLTAPEHLWIHCTHTHTGGMVPRGDAFTSDTEKIYPNFYEGKVDEVWVSTLVERTADAVLRAVADARTEDELTLHEGRENTVAHIRRYFMKDGKVRTNPGRNNPDVVRPAGEIDPRVHTLRFGKNRVLAVFYGLHPDCVGGTKYSADYPYHLTEGLKESLGRNWQVIYLNACCGNINHIDIKNTAQRSGPEESRRIGRTLATAVLASLDQGTQIQVDRLAGASTRVKCRLRRPKPEEVTEAEERLRTGRNPLEFNGLFAPAAVVLAKTKDREHTAEVAALRLGSFGLAAVPGEYFVELGREIEAGSPFRPTRTIGLTNGSMGYIPTREAYEQGGYESGYRSARYVPENGHNWARAAQDLLKKLAR
jgi:neutral ceramidase